VASLASALEEALSMDTDARMALGHRGRLSILNGYTLQGMRHATLDVYEEVLSGETALPA
jgi:hypothetical protein